MTRLPYEFQEGQKAYANKVMSNFYALLNAINNVTVPGTGPMELDAALALLNAQLNNRVKSSEIGNADLIRFSDGETMQQKLDGGDLNGADGVVSTSDGLYYFYIDGDGHLKLVTRSTVQGEAFSIDRDGHLIYTVDDPGTDPGDPVEYDLGEVRPTVEILGDMLKSVYDPNNNEEDIFAYVDTQVAAATGSSAVETSTGTWESGETTVEVTGITATNNFLVGISPTATQSQRSAWRQAQVSVASQAAGTITLRADGTEPTVAIPLSVIILP